MDTASACIHAVRPEGQKETASASRGRVGKLAKYVRQKDACSALLRFLIYPWTAWTGQVCCGEKKGDFPSDRDLRGKRENWGSETVPAVSRDPWEDVRPRRWKWRSF